MKSGILAEKANYFLRTLKVKTHDVFVIYNLQKFGNSRRLVLLKINLRLPGLLVESCLQSYHKKKQYRKKRLFSLSNKCYMLFDACIEKTYYILISR